ncbi:hypothetical protein SprV_0702328400 [Sparganum proliferum]
MARPLDERVLPSCPRGCQSRRRSMAAAPRIDALDPAIVPVDDLRLSSSVSVSSHGPGLVALVSEKETPTHRQQTADPNNKPPLLLQTTPDPVSSDDVLPLAVRKERREPEAPGRWPRRLRSSGGQIEQDVPVTKAICEADGRTDHRFVISEAPSATSEETTKVSDDQDWFEDNDADICNVLTERNRQNKAYIDRRTDANEASFVICRRLLQQLMREMQDTWRG